MPPPYRTPYHEDPDDLDISARGRYQPPSKAGLFALFSMLTSLGLLGIIFVLGILANNVGSLDGSGLIVFSILFLDIVAFVASLMALIFGLRAQRPKDEMYRGYGLAGVIGGIICLLATLAVGLLSMCAGLFLAAVHNVPGG